MARIEFIGFGGSETRPQYPECSHAHIFGKNRWAGGECSAVIRCNHPVYIHKKSGRLCVILNEINWCPYGL